MKKISMKIIIALPLLLLFVSVSCTTSTTIYYKNKNLDEFESGEHTIDYFERNRINKNEFVFPYVLYRGEKFAIGFSFYTLSEKKPTYNITDISIVDEKGNTIKVLNDINLTEDIPFIDEYMYRERFYHYSKGNLISADILQEEFYYIQYTINGKTIKDLLERKKKTYKYPAIFYI